MTTSERKRARLRAEGAASITLDQKIRQMHRDDFAVLVGDWGRVNKDLDRAFSKVKRGRERATA